MKLFNKFLIKNKYNINNFFNKNLLLILESKI